MSAPSSRLVRKEKSKLVKQIFIFIGLAVLLIALFIGVILPIFIMVLNNVINTDPFPDAASIELQTPLLNAPVTATNSAQLTLSGFAQPKNKITLLLNAKESIVTTASEDGSFELPLSLEEGENSVAVFSRDDKNNSSAPSQEYLIQFDATPPKIVVDEPQPQTHFDRKSRVITLRGITDAGSRVFINDRLVFTGTDGAFSTSVSLGDGQNDIKVIVQDAAGNRSEQVTTVFLDT
ncbi:hypothetical protein KA012_00815 [Candidatus Woesebacteria bacterium]|nr:hypothetical protein [Candidatus Woesebacteria bacterium]